MLKLIFASLLIIFIDSVCLAAVKNVTVNISDNIASLDATKYIQRNIDESTAKNENLKFTSKNKVILIGNTIKLPSNCNIDFNGLVLTRDAEQGVFDMMINANTNSGNTNIKISNLVLDGNKDKDHRVAENRHDRFSGLALFNLNNATLVNIEVNNTVNGEEQPEGNRAGIYFEKCKNVKATNLNGHNNDRTAIYIKNSSVTIDGSNTYNNKGSGISGNNSYDSNYYNIITHDNGYSQLSINGNNNSARNILAFNGAKGFSNINIGHDIASANASNTTISDVQSYNSKGWGLTVAGSSDVVIENAVFYNNDGPNILIFKNANNVTMSNIKSYASKSNGIFIKDGKGHKIDKSEVYANSVHGIEVAKSTDITIGPLVKVYNNGKLSSDIVAAGLAVSGEATVYGGKFYDNQEHPSQSFGIWAAGGKLIIRGNINVYGNKNTATRKSNLGTIIGEQFILYHD